MTHPHAAVWLFRAALALPANVFFANAWGYALLRQGQAQPALEIFKLNVSLFPQSWNAYDSLAETYESTGNKPQAIENYRRSLALNLRNANAVEHLRKLGTP